MRRSLAILMAAATVVAAAASFNPAQAAPLGPTPLAVTQNGGIEQIRDRRRGDDRWRHGDRWRHSDRSRRHHRRHGAYFSGFNFGFPFAYAPRAYYPRPYQPYYRYGDCFRTWDGQLICR
jgi:hypothetical protein